MEPAKKRSRICLNISEKIEICNFSDSFPSKSQSDIACHFSEKWNKDIKRRTVCDVLHSKLKWLDNQVFSKKIQPGKFPDLEKALFDWFVCIRDKNLPLTEDILKEKARYFANELNV